VSSAVLNFDDENVIEVSKSFAGKQITYGIENKNVDFYAENISFENGKPSYDLYYKEKKQGRLTLSVSGVHNVSNSLAVCAVAYEFGIPFETLKRGIYAFSGAKRRMEYKGSINSVDYYEDYAHHPTEIKATIASAKNFSRGDVWCIFQSHTYSRTAELFDDFVRSFDSADEVIFADIYSARETDTLGVSASLIAKMIGDKAVYCPSFADTADAICKEARENDVVIVMGAGDVYKVFSCFGDRLISHGGTK
jgi:UDP-N-acetylmuramate--alanine ligase